MKTKQIKSTQMPRQERFWDFVDTSGECWEWTGGHTRGGYGSFKAFGEDKSHRVSYVIEHGSIPDGMFILHKCDNTNCVRPSHLYAGTQQDNVRDRTVRERGFVPKGINHGRCKLSEDNVREVRERLANGETLASIGLRFGVGQTAICDIKHKRRWSHVT